MWVLLTNGKLISTNSITCTSSHIIVKEVDKSKVSVTRTTIALSNVASITILKPED